LPYNKRFFLNLASPDRPICYISQYLPPISTQVGKSRRSGDGGDWGSIIHLYKKMTLASGDRPIY